MFIADEIDSAPSQPIFDFLRCNPRFFKFVSWNSDEERDLAPPAPILLFVRCNSKDVRFISLLNADESNSAPCYPMLSSLDLKLINDLPSQLLSEKNK